MRADLLHVVTVVANPLLWESRARLYREFERHMLESGVNLTVVECAYGERPYQCAGTEGVTHIGVRAKTTAWTKECLLNLGIQRLPSSAKYIGTFDADVFFRRPGWAANVVNALQLYEVVQPWSDAYDLGPHDEHIQHHKSFANQFVTGEPVVPGGAQWWTFNGGPYDYPHSGYAWAWTRQALDWCGGLFEAGGMGSGDHHMALAVVGRVERSVPNGASEGYRRALMRWQHNAAHLNRSLGCVPGTIEHRFHGRKSDRQYLSRWGMFVRHGFDPETDLKRNTWGVLEFAGNKPELIGEWNLYLAMRNEDVNSL